MTDSFTKEVSTLTNDELDHQLRVFTGAVSTTPAVQKYRTRLELLQIEADRRNFETK